MTPLTLHICNLFFQSLSVVWSICSKYHENIKTIAIYRNISWYIAIFFISQCIEKSIFFNATIGCYISISENNISIFSIYWVFTSVSFIMLCLTERAFFCVQSPWNQFFLDNELRLTVKQDVIRTWVYDMPLVNTAIILQWLLSVNIMFFCRISFYLCWSLKLNYLYCTSFYDIAA